MDTNRRLFSRRQFVTAALGATSALWLSGCFGTTSARTRRPEREVLANEQGLPPVDPAAFNSLLQRGPVATDDAIATSAWAQRVREANMLRVGGIIPSPFFCLAVGNEGAYRGFDAGLFQLLARYVTGDASRFTFEPLGVGDREMALVDDLVDAVFATYVDTPVRRELIDFSNPYFASRHSILVLASTTDVNAVGDLANKVVAVKTDSPSGQYVQEACPAAQIEQVWTEEEARLALEQGHADAYVADNVLQLYLVACNPNTYQIVGDQLGNAEEYSIGLPKDMGAVDFVNGFLQETKNSGLLDDLRQVTIDNRVYPPVEEDELLPSARDDA